MSNSKPQPDMNTQILLDIQEQLKWIKLNMQNMQMELKCEIRGCKRALDACRVGFEECKKGYHDVVKGYQECAKGFVAVKEQCEEMEDTMMSSVDGSCGGVVYVV